MTRLSPGETEMPDVPESEDSECGNVAFRAGRSWIQSMSAFIHFGNGDPGAA